MSSKVKNLVIVLLVILTGVFVTMFISFSNDHKECSNIQEVVQTESGTRVISSKHICNEKYSF